MEDPLPEPGPPASVRAKNEELISSGRPLRVFVDDDFEHRRPRNDDWVRVGTAAEAIERVGNPVSATAIPCLYRNPSGRLRDARQSDPSRTANSSASVAGTLTRAPEPCSSSHAFDSSTLSGL